MSELVFILSDAHQKVVKILEKRGIAVMIEIPFPPYQVDCYLPEFHAALEVDGPQHSERERTRRDSELMRSYALPVFHVAVHDISYLDTWIPLLREFLSDALRDLDERIERREMSSPWI